MLRALALLAALLVGSGDGSDAWGVRPTGQGRDNFRFTAAPGEVLEDALVVTNHGTEELRLDLYAADGTLVDGAVEITSPGAVPRDLGAWVEIEVPALVLPPGEPVEVPFRIEVPPDAAPGSRAGAVVTSSLVDAGEVVVDRRLAVSVVVEVVEPRGAPSGVLLGLGLAVLVLAGAVLRRRAARG